MLDSPNINRQCEKCSAYNAVSLEENTFTCSSCSHVNVYDNELLKRSMEEVRKQVKKIQFKNPKNN